MIRLRTTLLSSMLAMLFQTCTPAEVIYSNLETPGNTLTAILDVHTLWDDINPTQGGRLSELRFIVRNRPGQRFSGNIEFRRLDNPDGGPLGTLLGEVFIEGVPSFDSLNLIEVYARSLESLNIILPDEPFVVGISPTENPWVFPFYGPPTIGFSSGARWLTQGGLTLDLPQNASYGWQFSVVPIPEPDSCEMLWATLCIAILVRWPLRTYRRQIRP